MNHIMAWKYAKSIQASFNIHPTAEEANAAFKGECDFILSEGMDVTVCRFDTEHDSRYIREHLEELMESANVTNRPAISSPQRFSPEFWKERLHLIQAYADGEGVRCGEPPNRKLDFTLPVDRYQIKPKTITVNGIEVEAPITVVQSTDQRVFVANPCRADYYRQYLAIDVPNGIAQRGLVHATKEGAIQHAKAMLEMQK